MQFLFLLNVPLLWNDWQFFTSDPMGLAPRASAPKQHLFWATMPVFIFQGYCSTNYTRVFSLGICDYLFLAFPVSVMLQFLFRLRLIFTMTPQELKKLKKELLVEKANIEMVLGEFTTENPLVKGDYKSHFHATDQSDTSDEKAHSVTDSEQERAVEQNLELRLREINETIKKIDEDAYGVCEKCSSPIDVRRLKVIPVAKFCVDCAKKAILI